MMTLLTINRVYYLIGFVVMLLVVMTLRDRANPKRFTTALFWFLFGGIFLFGDLMVQELGRSLAYRIIGGAVIVIALLAGFGLVGKGQYKMASEPERIASSKRLKNWLFLPALMIPVVTVIGTLFLKGVSIGGVYLLDQKQLTLAALCVACVAAILTGWWLTKGTPLHAVRQSRRLVDTIGWAVILPQMLAMLGGVFVVANTGNSVQKVVSLFVNPDSRFMLVVIYCVGMALFTMIMGNAFAAFPVLSAGIALLLTSTSDAKAAQDALWLVLIAVVLAAAMIQFMSSSIGAAGVIMLFVLGTLAIAAGLAGCALPTWRTTWRTVQPARHCPSCAWSCPLRSCLLWSCALRSCAPWSWPLWSFTCSPEARGTGRWRPSMPSTRAART